MGSIFSKALAKLSNKVGFNVPTLLDPTLFERMAAHVGLCSSNIFCSIKSCQIEFGFDQTFCPTILLDEKMSQCFAALPTKLYPEASHVGHAGQSRIAILFRPGLLVSFATKMADEEDICGGC